MALADADGLDALTMRALGAKLDVRAMSLYKHVADKDAILDGIVELVLDEIEVPPADIEWHEAIRRRATSSREVLARHSWAMGLIESRGTMGPASLRQAEAVLGCLRAAGLGIEDAAYAFWLLDSFVYGHVIQQAGIEAQQAAAEPGATGGPVGTPGVTERALADATATEHPHLTTLQRVTATDVFTSDRAFEVGLHLVIDAVSSMIDRAGA